MRISAYLRIIFFDPSDARDLGKTRYKQRPVWNPRTAVAMAGEMACGYADPIETGPGVVGIVELPLM